MTSHAEKQAALLASWPGSSCQEEPGQLRLKKSTISNLFRYEPRKAAVRQISLGAFNEVLGLDAQNRTMEVEGLTTMETVVKHSLAHGFLPLVAPELKHITVGGATVGIGIESTCFRHGFFHDGVREADVLLPDGKVVTCNAENDHADLFAALPNSYGTLGYILKARIALTPAKPYVHLKISRFDTPASYLDAMREATEKGEADFIEGLFFNDGRFYLFLGFFADQVPQTDDIVRRHIYYKLIQDRSDIYLTTYDYIFRYDPEWFWNIPDSWPYRLLRRIVPRSWRNSSFYTKYVAMRKRLKKRLTGRVDNDREPLIQDWEVPWDKAGELIEFCLGHVDLGHRPWAAVPIRAPRQPTIYPITPDMLYFNLGSYCQVDRIPGKPFHYTRILDEKCFALGGIKMLYSSTFMSEAEFDARFNGPAYHRLKEKYDPEGRAPTLYSKVVIPPP